MTVEMTVAEAELLIAILTGAEGAFAVTSRELVLALEDLRPWRTALMRSYLHQRMATVPTTEKGTGA